MKQVYLIGSYPKRFFPLFFPVLLLFFWGCVSVPRSELAAEYFSIAEDYFAEKNYVRALEYFQRAKDYGVGGDQDIAYNIAIIELIEGNLQQAEKTIQELKTREPDNLLVKELEALLFYQKGYYLAALKIFSALRTQGVSDTRIVQNIAVIYAHLQDNTAFIEYFQYDTQGVRESYLALLAESHKTLGNFDEATVIYKEYVKAVRSDEEKLLLALDFFEEVGDYTELLALYDILLSFNENNARYVFETAYIQLVYGLDFAAGLVNLRKALRLQYTDTARLQALQDAELFDPASVQRIYQEFSIELPAYDARTNGAS